MKNTSRFGVTIERLFLLIVDLEPKYKHLNTTIMSFEQQAARIERLIGLIDSSNTGTAADLAKKLCVSRRTIFYDFEFLKGKGHQIFFCYVSCSYRFEKNRKIF